MPALPFSAIAKCLLKLERNDDEEIRKEGRG